MDTAKKYEGQSITDLGKLFFKLGNAHLVPELSRHITIALDKFRELQENDDELNEMIIVADVEERMFVFAKGNGSDLTCKDDECVFYIAKSDEFNDTMEFIQYICFGNHPEGYLNLSSEVYHWIGDAMPDIDEDVSVTIHGGYYYGEAEDDPFWES